MTFHSGATGGLIRQFDGIAADDCFGRAVAGAGDLAGDGLPDLVVGASLAGLRTVEALRRGGYAGELILIGEEGYPPYDRPPLSNEVLRGE